jgi:hypothetical protein
VTVAGAAPETGQETVFSRPVLTAAAFVKRDRTVLADAWLPDLVRLGVLEAHLGDGVIEKIVAKALRNGRLPLRERRRLLSYPMVIRLVIAMTLLPQASYAGAVRTLAGLLADVPFTREWHVPTGKTVGEWRMLIPPEITEEVFWHAAGPLIGDDEPSAFMVAGMPADAADGMLVNLADTKENRAYFGMTGTGGRVLPVPAAADHRADRPRRPGDPRRGPRQGPRRRADPAEDPRVRAARAVHAPRHHVRPELSRS